MHITRPNVVVRAGRTITGCKVLFPAMVPMMNGIRNNINNSLLYLVATQNIKISLLCVLSWHPFGISNAQLKRV